MNVLDAMIRKLTEAFIKNKDSNIGKLFLLVSEQIESLNETFIKIENWRDINQAEGIPLNEIGENFSIKRGKASDELMRVLIRAGIARNNSDGSINSIIEALALSLNTHPSKIKISAGYKKFEPASIVIESIDADLINKANLTHSQLIQIAEEIVAAGVRLYYSLNVSTSLNIFTGGVISTRNKIQIKQASPKLPALNQTSYYGALISTRTRTILEVNS